MAFSPVSLPIQELLLTNFVTDIATISNANDLLLQDKLEDLINLLEIDIAAGSIGTDNPINYLRANTVILQDTGFIFQTGTPSTIIAKLEKNSSTESVLNVDHLTSDISISGDDLNINTVTVNDSLDVNGPATFTDKVQYNASLIESKQTVTLDLTKNGIDGEARLTLTSASTRNIFVKLKATTAPTLNYVYDGAGGFDITGKIKLYIDFDATNPPAENTAFTISFVDITDEAGSTSIIAEVNTAILPITINGGYNLAVTPTASIILHNTDSNSMNIGVNPTSITLDASKVLQSNVLTKYGHNISLRYILDENTNDRLIVTGMVGLEFFA